MEQFNKWCSEYSGLVSLVSVILSGLVSLIVTVIYYKKSNVNNVKASIVDKIYEILEQPFSRNNRILLTTLVHQYSISFLNKKQKKCLYDLDKSYSAISIKRLQNIEASAIVKHYHSVLKKRISIEVQPLYDDENNWIDDEIPDGADIELYIFLTQLNDKHWLDYENDLDIEEKINKLLAENAKNVFGYEETIDYFEGTSVNKIINEYSKMKLGNDMECYNKHKEAFYDQFPKK